MEREKLFRYLDKKYSSKRDMLSRIPLGTQPEALWQELINIRRSKSTVLPLYGPRGTPYWYLTTERMISASEKIIETLFENETEFDPYDSPSTVSTLEEVFFTGFVEGSQITMKEAMDFLAGEQPPRDIEEQLIANNRAAGGYAAKHLGKRIDETFLHELAAILTDGMDNGGGEYRTSENVDYIPTDSEIYTFPRPQFIPGRMNNLCAYLSASGIHPLIKAAVAQAYILALRPFDEGNDRLGRIISSMILLRAGYTFLNDVSLSALIARKSYGYYEAISNILREENEGDLTYFLEYFLELLSRAVDERRLRLNQREEQVHRDETGLARAALVTSTTQTYNRSELQQPPETEAPTPRQNDAEQDNNDFFDDAPTEETFAINAASGHNESVSLVRVKDELYNCTKSDGAITKKCAELLLSFMEKGIKTFTVDEIERGCSVTSTQAGNLITHFRERGLIESGDERINRRMVYRFGTKFQPLAPKDYAEEVIGAVNKLLHSARSTKDQRAGEMIRDCLPKGIISVTDYEGFGGKDKLVYDMHLPELMGLVERLSDRDYRICRQIAQDTPKISAGQKNVLTRLYRSFQQSQFTREMAMEALSQSKSGTCSTLHQLTILRILECSEEAPYNYRLLVNPNDEPALFLTATFPDNELDDNPKANNESSAFSRRFATDGDGYSDAFYEQLQILAESANSQRDRRLADSLGRCLEKGILLPDDYKAWGYSVSMWQADTGLAMQLGLITKQTDGSFVLNQEFNPSHPELKPSQKKAVTAIYEAFGDREFSQEMFVATLNYSTSYTYAALHKLTLLRVLEQKSTDAGSQYQLLVNPEENPECFDLAA